MSTVDDTIIAQHNAERRRAGLPLFLKRQALTFAAQKHAFRMAYTIGLSHDHWDTEIRDEGYDANPIGQNIASGCSQSSCIGAWMNSPPHRANILNPAFVRIGVGNVGSWWAVNFGGLQ